MTAPPELDGFCLRQAKLIGGLTQTQRRDEASAHGTAGCRKRGKASCDSKHPQARFLHNVLLALTAGVGKPAAAPHTHKLQPAVAA
jgi:hypothetical protein